MTPQTPPPTEVPADRPPPWPQPTLLVVKPAPSNRAWWWLSLGLFLGVLMGGAGAFIFADSRRTRAYTDRALQDLAADAAQYGNQDWWPAHERITRASILEDVPSAANIPLSVGMIILAVVVMAVSMRAAWRAWRAHPTDMQAHRALLERLSVTWARVLRTETVGSQSNDDRLTHYVLALELLYWPLPSHASGGYRQPPGEPVRCNVRWAIEASAAGHVVPGVYFGVSYDRADPTDVSTMTPQMLVALSGASLPLR